jgi:DNA-binding NarL/FixJ family response regulator
MVIGRAGPDPSEPIAGWDVGASSPVSAESEQSPGILMVVERREFVRGCLTCWLAKYCSEIVPFATADLEAAGPSDMFRHCIAAIIGTEASNQRNWLFRQVAWLRANNEKLPIILIADTDEESATAADLAVQLDLQGYIPASSSLEVAAAAVHLVVAGGSYFPRRQNDKKPRPKELLSGHEHLAASLARVAELTSRELAVLNLLGTGTPNKVIAHRLNMSLSTVKAHVHHIIRKLRVGNRTEAALLTQHLRPDTTIAAHSGLPSDSRHGLSPEPEDTFPSTNKHTEGMS